MLIYIQRQQHLLTEAPFTRCSMNLCEHAARRFEANIIIILCAIILQSYFVATQNFEHAGKHALKS